MQEENATHQPVSPNGPTLDQQLTESRVRPGSALESLVKNNQEFDLLDPTEFNDHLPFPLWLRVYVRKAHPEIEFTPGKPGYPLVLERVLEYMIGHQDSPEGSAPASSSQSSSAV